MERVLSSETKTAVKGFADESSLDGSLKINVSFGSEVINDGNDTAEFPNPQIQEVELLEQRKSKNGINGLEGELLVNKDANISIEIGIDGSVSITGEDVDKYEIDELGQLIYTY